MDHPDAPRDAAALLDRLKRHLTTIAGFSDQLLERFVTKDRTRFQVSQIHEAAQAALRDVPRLRRLVHPRRRVPVKRSGRPPRR